MRGISVNLVPRRPRGAAPDQLCGGNWGSSMCRRNGNAKAAALALGTLWLAVTPALSQFETRGTSLANQFPTSIALGDFNHDGMLDLAVVAADNANGVVILLGNGDGTFRRTAAYSAGEGAVSVVAADFDRDGNLDLAVANSLSSYLTILLGNGDGTFRAGPQNPTMPQAANFVGTGDFNHDGIIDLVAFSYAYPHNLSV